MKLHSDGERIAVLMPLNQTVEVWLTAEPIRLQSHTVQSDSCFLIWQDNLLLTAPLYSGIIQTVDTKTEREVCIFKYIDQKSLPLGRYSLLRLYWKYTKLQ